MPCFGISDCAQMSKSIFAAWHFELGGRESLETAVTRTTKISPQHLPKTIYDSKKFERPSLLQSVD